MWVPGPRAICRFLAVAVFCACALRLVSAQSALDQRGNSIDPIATAHGKPVVLIFVRTDCPISNRYAPEIQRLSAKYARQANFWLIYPSKSDTFDLITAELKEFGYKLPALRDPEYVLVKRAHAEITPEAAVFNAHGELVYHGRIDDWYEDFGRARAKPTTHELDDAVAATLNGRAVAKPETKAVGCYLADLQ